MHRFVLAAVLLAGCRGDHDKTSKPAAGSSQPAAGAVPDAGAASIVPHLPHSPDGVAELRSIDEELALPNVSRARRINLLLGRAALTSQLEDYTGAVADSEALIAESPKDPAAWKLRVMALSRVHRFADARAAFATYRSLAAKGEWEELAATLDEATGHPELAAPVREQFATVGSPDRLTMLAADLALRGKLDEAIAIIPKAAAAVHDNSPEMLSWLLFQWGRLYEQKGEMAAARDLYAEAHRRMPSYLEATVHLAAAMTATGQDPTAIVAAALAAHPHPELLALAGKTDEAKRGWERYLAALPEAFSDHAARFYLGPGADPARALVLARANLANRDTPESRALVAEAALAAGDPAAACEAAGPLATAPLRAQQFIAWRAFSACGRAADADKLAAALHIR